MECPGRGSGLAILFLPAFTSGATGAAGAQTEPVSPYYSRANTSVENPGIDSGLFTVTYSFGK
jgi:hypothetical protein